MTLLSPLLFATLLGSSPSTAPLPSLAVADTLRHGSWAESSIPAKPFPGALGIFVRSAALPGWGQRALGQDRGWLYTATDMIGWAGYAQSRRSGREARGAYRDFAWKRARMGVSEGPRVEGPWEYYETMARFSRSGRFDRVPQSSELFPEDDPETYNGLVWRLAREIHMTGNAETDPQPGDPGWDEAVEFYRSRAIQPEFAWDWQGEQDAVDRFSGLIRKSDRRYRRATAFAGALMANRFLSGVDGYFSAVASRSAHLPSLELQTRLIPEPRSGGWTLSIRFTPTRGIDR